MGHPCVLRCFSEKYTTVHYAPIVLAWLSVNSIHYPHHTGAGKGGQVCMGSGRRNKVLSCPSKSEASRIASGKLFTKACQNAPPRRAGMNGSP